MSKLKVDLDEANIAHEGTLAALRQKHNNSMASLGEQIDAINKVGGEKIVHPPPSSDLVTLPDPEIGLENLVEAKHHRLARSARTGIYERDLKPNPEIRNKLTQILGTPATQALTGEELDLIWR